MRIKSLDSLRGVAALVVVFAHCFGSPAGADQPHARLWKGGLHDIWSWLYQTPLYLFIDGGAAVLVFFVLSGVVLALTFVGRDQQHYMPYIVKRITRIWPPFAVAILMAAGLNVVVHQDLLAGGSIWLSGWWRQPVTPLLVLNHLALINGTIVELDDPMWSLVHEMRISLIFPIIVFAVQRRPILALACSIGLLCPVAFVSRGYGVVAAQIANTAGCLFLFVAGAAMGVRMPQIKRFITAIPGLWTPFIWCGALLLMTLAPYANGVPGSLGHTVRLLMAGVGSIVVVALCMRESPVTRVLETRIPSWLGRVSYSLYLIHMPIFLALLHVLPTWPIPLTLALGVAVSLAASEGFHRLFELPPARFGKHLAARLGPTPTLAVQT